MSHMKIPWEDCQLLPPPALLFLFLGNSPWWSAGLTATQIRVLHLPGSPAPAATLIMFWPMTASRCTLVDFWEDDRSQLGSRNTFFCASAFPPPSGLLLGPNNWHFRCHRRPQGKPEGTSHALGLDWWHWDARSPADYLSKTTEHTPCFSHYYFGL